jgi:hypothetical protein
VTTEELPTDETASEISISHRETIKEFIKA